MKFKLYLTAILPFLIVLIFSSAAFAKDEIRIIDGNKAVEGKTAPRFIAELMNKEEFNLTEYLGKKPIIISFWATHCEPCLKELPELQKFYEKYEDKVVVIAISSDPKAKRKFVENKIKEMKLTFLTAMDSANKLRTKLYQSRTIPFVVVINSDGKIVSMMKGVEKPENFISELEKLLGDDLKEKTVTKTNDDTSGTVTGTAPQ